MKHAKQTRSELMQVRLTPGELALVRDAAEADLIPASTVLRRGGLAEAGMILKRHQTEDTP